MLTVIENQIGLEPFDGCGPQAVGGVQVLGPCEGLARVGGGVVHDGLRLTGPMPLRRRSDARLAVLGLIFWQAWATRAESTGTAAPKVADRLVAFDARPAAAMHTSKARAGTLAPRQPKS